MFLKHCEKKVQIKINENCVGERIYSVFGKGSCAVWGRKKEITS